MTTEPNRPTQDTADTDKTVGVVLSERYLAALEQMHAHDQNAWVEGLLETHPGAAFAHVNIENDISCRFASGVKVYATDGSQIDLDTDAEEALEEEFDTSWDMSQHKTADTKALFDDREEVFSLRSIQEAWSAILPAVEATVYLSQGPVSAA